MYIEKVMIKNYRCLRSVSVPLNKGLNIIVGNNECGKSTLLEAINLALTGQLNGRYIQAELHPFLFNIEVAAQYLVELTVGRRSPPPSILIELYFANDTALAKLKGRNNSCREDVPGVKIEIAFDEGFAAEYDAYMAKPADVRSLPIEYYTVRWRNFADNDITIRSLPIHSSLIDPTTIRNNATASRYVVDIIRETLDAKQRADLALSYRLMKDNFLEAERVREVNEALKAKGKAISDKTLKVSLDTSSRSSWETGVMPHLDEVPMTMVGKGEQNMIKIKLALEGSAESHLILVEEPENHLSFTNLNRLIGHIAQKRGERQIIITTHSSFVMNKLGVEAVTMFARDKQATLKDLPADTTDYFLKLPGHDTLRLILAKSSILVEGPSDELIVQKAYLNKHGKLPIEDGIDVITVNSLAFKRFLDIAKLLKAKVQVITDNDGNVASLKKKYNDYNAIPGIDIQYDDDETYRTLEPQIFKANGLDVINKVLGQKFADEVSALNYMSQHKTDVALKFFETKEPWAPPGYIYRGHQPIRYLSARPVEERPPVLSRKL
jgi:putative ATP-dependent endonuclease of OLD family